MVCVLTSCVRLCVEGCARVSDGAVLPLAGRRPPPPLGFILVCNHLLASSMPAISKRLCVRFLLSGENRKVVRDPKGGDRPDQRERSGDLPGFRALQDERDEQVQVPREGGGPVRNRAHPLDAEPNTHVRTNAHHTVALSKRNRHHRHRKRAHHENKLQPQDRSRDLHRRPEPPLPHAPGPRALAVGRERVRGPWISEPSAVWFW